MLRSKNIFCLFYRPEKLKIVFFDQISKTLAITWFRGVIKFQNRGLECCYLLFDVLESKKKYSFLV